MLCINLSEYWTTLRDAVDRFSSSLRPGSKALTGENNLLVTSFLKVNMAIEPDLAHS